MMRRIEFFHYTIKPFLLFVIVLATISVAVGVGANQLREKPLELLYKDKEARISEAVERIQASEAKETAVHSELPKDLDYAAMKEIVENGRAIILDARPPLFYRLGHIPNSLSLPRDEFEEGYKAIKETLEADKNCPLVIYCANSTCDGSKLLETALKRLGYTRISIYLGGWQEWNNKKGTTDEHR